MCRSLFLDVVIFVYFYLSVFFDFGAPVLSFGSSTFPFIPVLGIPLSRSPRILSRLSARIAESSTSQRWERPSFGDRGGWNSSQDDTSSTFRIAGGSFHWSCLFDTGSGKNQESKVFTSLCLFFKQCSHFECEWETWHTWHVFTDERRLPGVDVFYSESLDKQAATLQHDVSWIVDIFLMTWGMTYLPPFQEGEMEDRWNWQVKSCATSSIELCNNPLSVLASLASLDQEMVWRRASLPRLSY